MIVALSSTPSYRLAYSAALDGLRAIAVIAVVGYHLDIPWMRGGFLGVDLFFVISGFLITRILIGEQATSGRIALGSFWIRRFRRLVPPMVIVVAASVAATRFWGVPAQWDSMRLDATASLLYVANWRFILDDVSYFETLLGPSPLRHIWSLAVEEQWYVLWPLVMAALAPWVARRGRIAYMGPALLVAAALSAIWMAVLYDPANLSRVYYGTDTRAQQLLVGAALGWATVAAPRRFSAVALARWHLPASAVLVGFAVATVLINDEARWLYHGGLLALSLGAAVLVAAASLPGTDGPLGWLASRPLVAIGRRSYSLYLWHWPVIVFVGPPMGLELSRIPLMLVQVAVSMLLTEATYRWIETPTRLSVRRPIQTVAAWTTAGVVTIVAASMALASPFSALADIEVLRPSSIPQPDSAVPDTTRPVTPQESTSPRGSPAPSPDPEPSEPSALTPRFMLLGDSTALVLGLARPEELPTGWEAVGYARLGCAITPGQIIDAGEDQVTDFYDPQACSEWYADWTELSQEFEPSVSAIMVGAWEVLDHVDDGQRLSFPSDEWTDYIDAAIKRGVQAASAGGGRVALLRLPCMEQSTDSLVSNQARNDPARIAAFNDILEDVATEQPEVFTLPLDDLLCPNGEPIGEVDGEEIRYDGVHLSEPGTLFVWNWLDAQLQTLDLTSS